MIKKPTKQFPLFSVVLCSAPMILFAHQSDFETLLKNCASIDNDGQRHSCYDQVLRPNYETDGSQIPAAAETSDKPEPVSPSQAQRELEEGKAIEVEKSGPQESQPVEVVADEPVEVEKFGLKEKQPRESVHITVTVKEVRKSLTNRYVYITTNGQVWMQIDTRNVRYHDVPFVAEIRSASLGSYYLKPESDGVSVRVRREK